jgi:acyl-CoA synthetase (AMP-forming)/AMP-acid ligase II
MTGIPHLRKRDESLLVEFLRLRTALQLYDHSCMTTLSHFFFKVCMKGRHVFMGYLNNEQKTTESLDEDGYLHSGDIGKLDKVTRS